MAKIVQFPPQPGIYEELPSDWFYDEMTCRVNAGTPDGEERSCPLFVKKYPGDKVESSHCHCLLCANMEEKPE